MLGVEETSVKPWLDRGMIEVAVTVHTSPEHATWRRLWLMDPADTCLRPMRGWVETYYNDPTRVMTHHGFCLMPKDHRGRCSTKVFWCDSCGKARRGYPAVSHESNGFCWMCVGMPAAAYGSRRKKKIPREEIHVHEG